MPPIKVFLFANTDWYLYNFRLALAEKLRHIGLEVVLVCPRGEYFQRLENKGFRCIPFEFSTRSTNLFRELGVIARLWRLYRKERPVIAHHFTIKCVLYGSLAARFCGGVRVVNAVTGLGYIFIGQGIKAQVLRPVVKTFYKFTMSDRIKSRAIFQNSADLQYFLDEQLVDASQVRLVRGSGVNCERFYPAVDKKNLESETRPRILFASRMLKEKGVTDVAEAAVLLRSQGIEAEFLFAGDIYPANPSSLTREEIQRLKERTQVEFLGHVDDMPALVQSCDVVVLPTYYGEGVPRILIEASAAGKPVIGTDMPGCLELITDGVNGCIVPPRDPAVLAEAIRKLIINPELCQALGKAGRQTVLKEFEEGLVLGRTIDVYRDLIPAIP